MVAGGRGGLEERVINMRLSAIDNMSPTLDKIRTKFGRLTKVLQKSLIKRGGFDFNKQLNMDVADASARRLASSMANVGAKMKSASSITEAIGKSFGRNNVDGIQNMNSAIVKTTKSMQNLIPATKRFIDPMKRMTQLMPNFNKQGKLMGLTMEKMKKKMKQGFDLNSLGIMFFGMAIQRVFTGIAKATTEMFTKIMDSSEASTTNVQILGTMFDFLKFKIGSAINNSIGPLIPKIFEVVSTIARWIGENEELVAKIIAVGIAVGSFLFILGTLKLGFAAIAGTVGKFVAVLGLGGTAGLYGVLGLLIIGFINFKKSIDKGFETKTLQVFKDTFENFRQLLKSIGLEIKDMGDLLDLLAGVAFIAFKNVALGLSVLFNTVFLVINAGISSILNGISQVQSALGQKDEAAQTFAKSVEFSNNATENLKTIKDATLELIKLKALVQNTNFRFSEILATQAQANNIIGGALGFDTGGGEELPLGRLKETPINIEMTINAPAITENVLGLLRDTVAEGVLDAVDSAR